MSNFEFIKAPTAPEAIGPYTQAVISGNMVFCSGQIPLDPKTRELKNGTIEEATRQVLCNMRGLLASTGCSLTDVVKCTVFMVDLKDFAGMNSVYAEVFGPHRPARSTVQVAALPAGARVEIECIAVRPQ
jgi:2-iminobutanoate/2-iminopropanoate deaminase